MGFGLFGLQGSSPRGQRGLRAPPRGWDEEGLAGVGPGPGLGAWPGSPWGLLAPVALALLLALALGAFPPGNRRRALGWQVSRLRAGFAGFFYCWPLPSYCIVLYSSCGGGRGAGPAARAVSRGLAALGVAMSASISSRFFSVPARFSGRCVARVHSATRSVWVWRAPRAGQLASPACLFWPVADMAAASGLAHAAASLGSRVWVKPAASCAVFAFGPLVGFAVGPVVKIELPPHRPVALVRRALVARWLGLSASA